MLLVLCLLFALNPAAALSGARSGVELCLTAVVPSLLPFLLISSLLMESGLARPLGAAVSKVLRPLLGLDATASVCFVTGLLGGYPVGATAVFNAFRRGELSRAEAARLLTFCNNSGPLFLLCTAGIACYGSARAGIMLYLSHLLAAMGAALLFAPKQSCHALSFKESVRTYRSARVPIATLVAPCSMAAVRAMAQICTMVITFGALLEILPFGRTPLLAGALEITRGVALLSEQGMQTLPLASLLLAWGGVSVHLQVIAVRGTLDIPLGFYIAGKLCCALFSFLFCTLLLRGATMDHAVLCLSALCLVIAAAALRLTAGFVRRFR